MRQLKIFFIAAFAVTYLGAQEESVTLQLKWKHQFQFAGYYAALHKGYYKEAGLNVAILQAQNDTNPVEKVLSGAAEYGVGNSDILLFRNKGYQPVLLAVFLQHSPLALMVRADSGIKTPQELVGKKILLEPNANEVKGWLKRANLDESKLQIIQGKHELSKLINKEIDAITIYTTTEPALMDKLAISYKLFNPIDAGIDFYGDNLFTSEKEIRKNPQRAKAFRDASVKGWKYAISNKDEIARLIHDKYSQERSLAELLAEAEELEKLMEMNIIEPGYYKEGRWRHIADTYGELGMLPSMISFDGFFYEEYLEGYPRWLQRAFYLTLFGLLGLSIVFWAFYRQSRRLRISEEKYKTLYEKAKIGFILLDKEMHITEWNSEAEQIFGYTKAEALGQNIINLLVPKNIVAEVTIKAKELINENKDFVSTNQNITKDGRRISCEWTNTRLINEKGETDGIVSLVANITQREELLKNLRDSEKTFKAMLDYAPFPVVITDYSTSEVLYVNQATADAVGETKSNLIHKKAIDYWADSIDREIYIKEITKKGYLDNFEVKFVRKDGTYFWAQMSATRMVCDHRDAAFIAFMNIDKQKQLRETLKTHSVAVEYAANGFLITDIDGTIVYTNPAFTEITGYEKDEVLGKTSRILKSGTYPNSFYEVLWTQILDGKIWRGEVLNKRKNGELYYQSMAIAPVKDDRGKIVKFVSILQDVTDKKQMEQKLQKLAHYDPLTTLANRTLFFEYLDEKILSANEENPLALMFVDLDGFKDINDTLGHEAGDEVLKSVAKRITESVSENEFVARMGGDEFTIIVSENLDINLLRECASKIIDEIGKPYQGIQNSQSVGASIGIALYPHYANTAKALLSKADEAMYKAKANGKNRYFIYGQG